MMLFIAIAVIFSYLAGSIPVGYIIAKTKGIDIRQVGSRNIGATNVYRCVGKGWGILTFLLDFLKGLIPVAGVFIVGSTSYVDISPEGLKGLGVMCASAAIAGHLYPVFLGFKGGKGVATAAGAILILAPLPLLVGLGSWIIIKKLTGYVSLASILASIVVVVCGHVLYLLNLQDFTTVIFLSVLCMIIVIRHRSNIARLIAGKEYKL